ncbi:SecY protein [Mycena kentingensis (nom. inval.)]|nr:SecY protein [Mycena kentingensis (nom. inval.)]
MPRFRGLNLARPFLRFLPGLTPVGSRQSLGLPEKLVFTASAALLFLSAAQLPLYTGSVAAPSSDPLYGLRPVLASTRGTLMELGVTPILFSGTLLQLLAGSNLIDVNFSKIDDRALFSAAQKALALVLAIVQATVCILGGLYGHPLELGLLNGGLIVGQLLGATYFLILLDEMLQKGHGMGAGVSLFPGALLCQTIAWQLLSFSTLPTPHGPEREGALIAPLGLLAGWPNKALALREAYWRETLPNLVSLGASVLVFGAVIFLQAMRLDLSVKSARFGNQRGTYPIKVLYTSSTSLVFVSTVSAYALLVSHAIAYHLPADNILLVPTSGLAYYFFAPPRSVLSLILSPIHTITYAGSKVLACTLFAQAWIEASGSGPRDVAKQLETQQIAKAGHRSMYQELKRVIPVAAAIGAASLALLSVAGDALGVFSGAGGTGLVVAVTTVYSYYEIGVRESGGPEMAAFADLL